MLSFRANLLIVFFWLCAMCWLIFAKVLPPLLLGEPPTFGDIIASETKAGKSQDNGLVEWDIYSQQQIVGYASSKVQPMLDDVHELRSEVKFWELPLDSISPLRLGAFARLPDGKPQSIALGAKAALEIDPLGRLLSFESTLEVSALHEPIHVQGTVDGTQLRVTLRSGDFVYRTESFLPHDSLLTDALSPQARLPGLRIGQTWLVPLYSPFHPRTRPLEALEAIVERKELLAWHGELVETLVVVYYNEQGGRLGGAKEPRGKLWVRPADGAVLQQEVPLLSSELRFVRKKPQPIEDVSTPAVSPAADAAPDVPASIDAAPKAATPILATPPAVAPVGAPAA